MSVSKWAYSPEKCDGEPCPGDCDMCSKAENGGRDMTNAEAIYILRQKYKTVSQCLTADECRENNEAIRLAISALERDTPKHVRMSEWKGNRNTRYKCPGCEKNARNDETYCHKCGQRLVFPRISFTDYVPGQKQEVIITWPDAEQPKETI